MLVWVTLMAIAGGQFVGVADVFKGGPVAGNCVPSDMTTWEVQVACREMQQPRQEQEQRGDFMDPSAKVDAA
jgi:hypothetical protein